MYRKSIRDVSNFSILDGKVIANNQVITDYQDNAIRVLGNNIYIGSLDTDYNLGLIGKVESVCCFKDVYVFGEVQEFDAKNYFVFSIEGKNQYRGYDLASVRHSDEEENYRRGIKLSGDFEEVNIKDSGNSYVLLKGFVESARVRGNLYLKGSAEYMNSGQNIYLSPEACGRRRSCANCEISCQGVKSCNIKDRNVCKTCTVRKYCDMKEVY